MSGRLRPSRDSLIGVRMSELDGWCGLRARRHPDQVEVLEAVRSAGRDVLDDLDNDGLLAVGIVGAALERYERDQVRAEP